MASVSLYLNFMGNTESAFEFYKSVFGTEYLAPPTRFKDVPLPYGAPPLTDEDAMKIFHIQLPIVGGFVLEATDMLESAGHTLELGNNFHINLNIDTRLQADELYFKLSQDALNTVPLAETPWGYWGMLQDKFGINWMFIVRN